MFSDIPLVVLACGAAGVFALTVFGLRGLLDIRDALRHADLARLSAPEHWQVTRAWVGFAETAALAWVMQLMSAQQTSAEGRPASAAARSPRKMVPTQSEVRDLLASTLMAVVGNAIPGT